ncbi:MAG: hypothetical protein GX094_08990 [Clostridiales bacterium]|mgnify:CR=1 FL=1|jgi:hypothetical protein|nr:hypothetical protein [Clostridiales bacterium]
MVDECDLSRALALARSKRKRLEEILNITRKQAEVLSADKAEQLLAYIGDKQRLIEEIDALDRQFMDIFAQIREQLSSNEYDAKRADDNFKENDLYLQLLDMMDEQKELLKTIYELEQENQKRAISAIEGVKTKLSGINMARRGYKAYKQPNRQIEGIFIDKRE